MAIIDHAKREISFCGIAYRNMLYRFRGLMRNTVTIRTRQGLLTIPTRDEGIGWQLHQLRQHEYDYSILAVEFLKDSGFIRANDVTMLDVGANIGHISIGLILSGEVNQALAIEPAPTNYEPLLKNIEQNDLAARIVPIQMAAGEGTGVLDMELSSTNPGDHRIRKKVTSNATEILDEISRQIIQVKSSPLKQLLELPEVTKHGLTTHPSFMWIDVQGYEGHVFKGGKGLLDHGLPTVSEVWPYGILRTGVSLEEFSDTVRSIWKDYWIERRGRFIRYPTKVFDHYLEELGADGYFENVIFTNGTINHTH